MKKDTQEYKTLKADVAKVIDNYVLYKFRIKVIQITNHKTKTQKESLELYNSYINFIDSILDTIKPEYKKLLIDVFAKHKKYYECLYSSATYYTKIREALEEFFKYYK